MSTERRSSVGAAMAAAIASGAGAGLRRASLPNDESGKAALMTQAAINGLGGPVFASMQDGKILDPALAKAQQDMIIQNQGEKSANPAKTAGDRAISEALTMARINSGTVALKPTEGRKSVTEGGLSKEQLEALQAAAASEKAAHTAAHTFGGGDAKEGMGSILKEIQSQGGVIAVPTGKVSEANGVLNNAKLGMEINALGGPIFASGTDHKVVDTSLVQAKTMMAIHAHTAASPEQLAALAKLDEKISHTAEALTLMSIAKPANLKSVEKPAEGLSAEKLAELQAQAAEEKKE